MKFILLINVKMPTCIKCQQLLAFNIYEQEKYHMRVLKQEKALFFCILVFMSNWNFMLSWVENETSLYYLRSGSNFIYVVWCVLYPYSTQATNRPNHHELIFVLFWGIREVSLIFFLQSWWATSYSRFRYDVVTNIRGGSIQLESHKNSLRLENNIRTCCTKVKESITNQLRICGMQQELGTN